MIKFAGLVSVVIRGSVAVPPSQGDKLCSGQGCPSHGADEDTPALLQLRSRRRHLEGKAASSHRRAGSRGWSSGSSLAGVPFRDAEVDGESEPEEGEDARETALGHGVTRIVEWST